MVVSRAVAIAFQSQPSDDGRSNAPISVSVLPEIILLE
jgi:hypothetical protein